MSVIYLRHPVHGAKVAISEPEAVYDETFGWERFDPTQSIAAPAPRSRRRETQDAQP